MRVKLLLFSMPIAIAVLFLAAFLIARQNFTRRLNELVISSSGDAEKLNPILATDSVSGEINDLVFNGLLKYDEDLEITGDLAESWAISQNSRFYLKPGSELSPEAAAARLRPPDGSPSPADAHIRAASVGRQRSVLLTLNAAGRAFEQGVLRAIPADAVRPIHILRVGVDTEAVFRGAKAAAPAVLGAVEEALKSAPIERIESLVESSDVFALKFLGDAEAASGAIKAFGEESVRQGKDGKPRPLCAVLRADTRLFDNEPVIRFALRKNVRWHDGKPFTSADVRFTYDKIMDESTNTVRRPMFELVKTVETPDPHTVVVTYKEPFSPCLENWMMGIIPRHVLEKVDINTASFNRKPIGTGPFRFLEWKTDERITVLANDDYFRGRPALDRISLRIIPEPQLRQQEFMIEGVDYETIAPHSYARFKTDERFNVYVRPSNSYSYIGWNQKEEMFQDVNVRRALCYAINREEMVKYLLYGLGKVADGIYPPHMWYYNDQVQPLPYDPKKARELLAQAGWKDTDGDGILDKNGKPFRFDLITNNGNPMRNDIAVLAQRQLRQVGVKVDIYLYEWSVFIRDKVNPRNYEACVLGWGLGLDPDCYEIWHSSQIPKGFNFVGYKDERADRLIEEGRTEFDHQKRKKIYQELSARIYEDQPYTFLFFPQATPSLHAGAFRLKLPRPRDGHKIEDIRMTKAGLTYYIDRWFRVTGTALEP